MQLIQQSTYITLGFSLLLLVSACVPQRDPETRDDGAVGLISVGNSTLFQEDIEGLTNDDMLPEDSAIVVSSFIERWGKDQLISLEAEKRFGDDKVLEELVSEYRQSLLLQYMTNDIESAIDTTISAADLQAFYQDNKDKYLLSDAAIMPLFIKIPRKSSFSSKIKSTWKKKKTSEGKAELLKYSQKQDVTIIANTWMEAKEVAALLEDDAFDSRRIRQGKEYIEKTDDFRYFLYLEKVSQQGEPAPLQFVYNRVRHAYRYQQKRDQIKEYRDNLYKKGIDKGIVRLGQ